MRSARTGVVSGCVLWVLLIGVLGSCILPVFFFIGTVTSFTEFAVKTTGGFLCPPETMPERYSYATTTRDAYGNSKPSTAYELRCVKSTGEVVQSDPIVYALVWNGILLGAGFLVTLGLSFFLAAPAGALINKILNRNQTDASARQPG
jgi:hypothetical protein